MNYDLQDSDLPTILVEASLVADETKRVFGRLSGEQVNWKPREGEWSIGQCFDHLVISNRPYVQIFDEILAGRRRQRVWERMPLLPRLFGRVLINTLRPDSGRRAKARPAGLQSLEQSHRSGDHRDVPRAAGATAASHGSEPQTRSRWDHDHVAGAPLRYI